MSWIYQGREINSVDDMPEGVFGFVYNILVHDGGSSQEYIGKKQVGSVRYPQISKKKYDELKAAGKPVKKTKDKKKSKKGKPVWKFKKRHLSETDWKTYVGSSDRLKEDVANGAKYTKYILHFAYSKQELSYLEERELFCTQVLEHGDKFYNGSIRGVYYKKLFDK